MQQLTIEHKEKSSTSNQIVDKESTRDRRFAKGMVVAVSCEIVAIDDQQKGTYKVQSENDVNKYYIVKFMDGTPVFCSCKDFEIQSQKNRNHICKHERAIVLAENYGLVQELTKQQHRRKLQKNSVPHGTQKLDNNLLKQSYPLNRTTIFHNNIIEDEIEGFQSNVIEDSSTINDNEDDNSNSRSYQSQNAAKFEETTRVESKSYRYDEYSF